VGAIALAGLVAHLEVGLRIRAAYEDFRLDRSMGRLEQRKPPPPGQKVTLAEMIQLSPNPRIIYELIPNLAVQLVRPVHTNGAGFRSPDVSIQKPPESIRLVGLGDSIMFGLGVGDGDPFMAALARKLGERQPRWLWESINTAVPGYNTVMEVETLASKGLAYAPDIVMINFVGGDDALPNFIRKRSQPLAFGRCFLHDFAHAWRTGRLDRDDFALADAPRADVGFVADPEKVPPEYRDMVGWKAYVGAMERLRDLSEANGFRVVVVGHPAVYTQVKELGRSLGFPVVESMRFMRRYMRANGIESDRDPRLIIAPRDSHPTALLHGIIADAIVDGLEGSGILADTLAARDPSLSALERRRLAFWSQLRASLTRIRPGLVRFGLAGDPLILASANGGLANLELAIDRSGAQLRVGLLLSHEQRARAVAPATESCQAVRDSIEADVGARIAVRSLEEQRANMVNVTRPFDLGDEARWPAAVEWMSRAAVQLTLATPRMEKCAVGPPPVSVAAP
jgi:hypothetical protein